MFINRLLELSKSHSFLLFGMRGCGKSALLAHRFNITNNLYINLLDPELLERYLVNPNLLIDQVLAMDDMSPVVIIDEIQKVPKLLDVVHLLIENKKSKNNLF